MAAVTQAVGAVLSAVWCMIGLLYLATVAPNLLQLSGDALVELLMTESGAVAFFWLAFGYIWLVSAYFYQKSLIRKNSSLLSKAMADAASALELVERESHKHRHYQLSGIRAAQPRWEVSGCIAHRQQCEINLRNLGAPASQLTVWTKDLPIVAMLSNATFVDRGHDLTIKVMFKGAPLEEFDLTLEYCDAAGAQRSARLEATAVGAVIRQEEF